ncbi:hypothetical protein HK100_012484 [Physocladia obscura]|uniref:Uncharacterized protein n=1 Tax=Physocladia obscura TaxID=109957 RepID=A0AAD5XKI8_9FUNG|nr:hypothetical protein HK100_012484 [Physocladia obscura]
MSTLDDCGDDKILPLAILPRIEIERVLTVLIPAIVVAVSMARIGTATGSTFVVLSATIHEAMAFIIFGMNLIWTKSLDERIGAYNATHGKAIGQFKLGRKAATLAATVIALGTAVSFAAPFAMKHLPVALSIVIFLFFQLCAALVWSSDLLGVSPSEGKRTAFRAIQHSKLLPSCFLVNLILFFLMLVIFTSYVASLYLSVSGSGPMQRLIPSLKSTGSVTILPYITMMDPGMLQDQPSLVQSTVCMLLPDYNYFYNGTSVPCTLEWTSATSFIAGWNLCDPNSLNNSYATNAQNAKNISGITCAMSNLTDTRYPDLASIGVSSTCTDWLCTSNFWATCTPYGSGAWDTNEPNFACGVSESECYNIPCGEFYSIVDNGNDGQGLQSANAIYLGKYSSAIVRSLLPLIINTLTATVNDAAGNARKFPKMFGIFACADSAGVLDGGMGILAKSCWMLALLFYSNSDALVLFYFTGNYMTAFWVFRGFFLVFGCLGLAML